MIRELHHIDIGGGVAILSLVKGLVSNEGLVEEALDSESPDILALPVSPEGLKDMRSWSGDEKELPITEEDALYIVGLRKFGKARLPPPEHLSGIKLADERKIRVRGVDIGEEEFSRMFCDNVSILDLWLRSRLSTKLLKREIIASTPEEYSDIWEELLMKNKGVAAVERERERYMALKIVELASRGKKILVIMERERAKGVLEKISSSSST